MAYGHHANVDTGASFLDVHTRDVLRHDVGICRGEREGINKTSLAFLALECTRSHSH